MMRRLPGAIELALALVAVALVVLPVMLLTLRVAEQRPARAIETELDPLAEAVHRLHGNLAALVVDSAMFGPEMDESQANAYANRRDRVDGDMQRLAAFAERSTFGPPAREVLQEARGLIAVIDRAVGGDQGEVAGDDVTTHVDGMLATFTQASEQLLEAVAAERTTLQADARTLDRGSRALTALGVLIGIPAVLVLAWLAMSRRRLLAEAEHARERAEQERTRFLSMVESSVFGVLQVRPDGSIEYVNPTAAELLSFQREEIMETALERLAGEQDIEGGAYEDGGHPILGSLRGRPESYFGRCSLRRSDGNEIAVEFGSYPVVVDGRLIGIVVVFMDITERLERERAQEQFIAVTSHELRSPLTSIVGFTRRLARAAASDPEAPLAERRSEIETLRAEAERMRSTVQLFLDMARIDAGLVLLDTGEVALTELLRGEADALRERFPHVDLKERYAAEEVLVDSDADRIRQIVTNLLDNAVRYGGDPPDVTLGLRVDDGTAVICVRDGGPGIPVEDQRHIFERLYRGQNADAAQSKGLGLGLYVSKEVARWLGADLSFTSRAGEGTEFTLRLPGATERSAARPTGIASEGLPA